MAVTSASMRRPLLFHSDARVLLLEPREAPAPIQQLLLPAGPGRMRLRIDVKTQRIALLAPGGAGSEFATIGHDHLDGVIVRMNIWFHDLILCRAPVSAA